MNVLFRTNNGNNINIVINKDKKIDDFFRMSLQPKIYVNNARDLIGAN